MDGMGWMGWDLSQTTTTTRAPLAVLINDESGIHARFYMAPDGTIFRSKTCMLKFLLDQGKLDQYQMLKKMQLHRKRSFVQV